MELLPFADFKMNVVWMELVLTAQLLLTSGFAPKRLRYRALHAAGRLSFHARRATLCLERLRRWAEELAAAFARLRELPASAG